MYRVGVDVGGTFTDLVAVDGEGRVTFAKAASTPADPSLGILDGLRLLARELGVDPTKLEGSGRTGRILERDVRSWALARGAPAAEPGAADLGP